LIVIVGLFIVIALLPQLLTAKITLYGSLPTWEVNNPVSTIFVMDSIPLTSGSLAAGDSTVPDAYLVDPAIDTLFLLMETKDIYFHKTVIHPEGIVGADDIVVIKGNFLFTSRLTTSTDRIKGVIWQILQHPDGFSGEIIVCDNTQEIYTSIGEDDNNSEDPDQSIVDVVNTFYSKGYPVYVLDWNYIWDVEAAEYSTGDYDDGYVYEPISKISYPKFRLPASDSYISLRYGIWDSLAQIYDLNRLCIIDFPVLKAHSMAGASIAIKNWIGVLTTAYQESRYGGSNPMHYQYFFGEYALVAKVMGLTFPKLAIVDAAWTSTKSHKNLSYVVNTKMLLASTDPCAVSWYAAKFILTPIAVTPFHTNPDQPGGDYYENIGPWTSCLHDSGFASTIDSSEMSVYNLSFIPVELTSFSATINNSVVDLYWSTSTETNNFGFHIERSKDKIGFNQIAFVPGSGTTTEIKTYSYIDSTVTSGKYYYRLKQVDYNGNFSYSMIVEVDLEFPTKFVLEQNYPNPFNPSTSIEFELPVKSFVSLKVYDLLGSEIVTLVNEEKPAGSYEVEFFTIGGTTRLPSGIYFYRLQAANFVETKKMVFLK